MHDVRDLGGRLYWLMISLVLGFASMYLLLWGLTKLVNYCGRDGDNDRGGDPLTMLVGAVVLTLAWYAMLQWLDRYLTRRRDRVMLARAWIPTARKRDRAPRATI